MSGTSEWSREQIVPESRGCCACRVQRDCHGNLQFDPPPDNSWTLAGQIEYQLWLSRRGHGDGPGREVDRLVDELMSRPPLAAELNEEKLRRIEQSVNHRYQEARQ